MKKTILAAFLLAAALLPQTGAESLLYRPIGPQIEASYPMMAETDDRYLYVALQGSPGYLNVLDLNTFSLIASAEFPGSNEIWSLSAGRNGVFAASSPNEHVYHYERDTGAVTDYGKMTIPKNTFIGDIEYVQDSDTLYGSVSYGGGFFRHTPGGRSFYSGTLMPHKKMGRSVAYHGLSSTVFVGLGAPASLVAYSEKGGRYREILPEIYKKESFVYDTNVTGDYLFAKLNPSNTMLIFKASDRTFIKEIPATSRGTSVSYNGFIYYTNGSALMELSEATLETKKVATLPNSRSPIRLSIIHRSGVPYLFSLLGNNGEYMQYEFSKKTLTSGRLSFQKQPVTIYSLHADHEGGIISSGFVSGKASVYHANRTQTPTYEVGQVESVAELGGTLYFGTYPGAKIIRQQAGTPLLQPEYRTPLLKDMLPPFDVSKGELTRSLQERPEAMATVPEEGRIYIGTSAKDGVLTSSLSYFDEEDGEFFTYPGYTPNAHIQSLVYDGTSKLIFGSTSTVVGTGTNPSGTTAKLFTFAPSYPLLSKKEIPLPFTNRTIYGLTFNKGKLWGYADGTVFRYDPLSGETRSIRIAAYISGYSQNKKLLLASDGFLYSNLGNQLYRIHPDTLAVEHISSEPIFEDIAVNGKGILYFKQGETLYEVQTT